MLNNNRHKNLNSALVRKLGNYERERACNCVKKGGSSKERLWEMKVAGTNNNKISSRIRGASRRRHASVFVNRK